MPEKIAPTPVIQTRKCRQIPLEKSWLITREEVAQDLYNIDKRFADRVRRRDRKCANAIYNCHGLTFASRRAPMSPDYIALVLEDDEYHQIDDVHEVRAGDIAVYYDEGLHVNISHTGVVVNVDRPFEPSGILLPSGGQSRFEGRTIWILSKWGYGPEVEHPVDYCPYGSDHVVYMREGKNDVITNF